MLILPHSILPIFHSENVMPQRERGGGKKRGKRKRKRNLHTGYFSTVVCWKCLDRVGIKLSQHGPLQTYESRYIFQELFTLKIVPCLLNTYSCNLICLLAVYTVLTIHHVHAKSGNRLEETTALLALG